MTVQAGETNAERLQADYPGWHVWRSDAGALWATRTRRLTNEQLAAGLVPTLDGPAPSQLRDQLADQEQLAQHWNARVGVTQNSSSPA